MKKTVVGKATSVVQVPAAQPLVLVPTLFEQRREQIEAWLVEVRAKRMVAAVLYNETQNAKLDRLDTNLKRRIESKLDLLDRAMHAADKTIDRVQKYMDELEMLTTELNLNRDLIKVLNKETNE